MVCSDLGQPGTELGTPQEVRRFPSWSNSITAGGAKQHSPAGGLTVAAFSRSSKSRGRFSTQMWSSLSTNIPVMPSMVQLLGSCLGQVGSYLQVGGLSDAGAPTASPMIP